MASRYLYQMEVSHKGLNKYSIVKADTEEELMQKANALQAQWDTQWAKIVEREKKRRNVEDAETAAKEASQQAADIQVALDNILKESLSPKALDVDEIKDFSSFPEPSPKYPEIQIIPDEPLRTDEKYNPTPSFMTKLFKKKMKEFEEQYTAEFEKDHEEWKKEKIEIEATNQSSIDTYQELKKKWKKRKDEFEERQNENNKRVDSLFRKAKTGDAIAIEWYFQKGIEKLELPIDYSRAVELEYDPEGKTLIVEIMLPILEDIPNLKGVTYIKSRNEFKESYYTETYLKKKYDNVLYQVVLQTLNYIFTVSSEYQLIDTVVLNGKVHTIDRATGNEIEPCILSISVARDAFEGLNLEAIDPKAWFRSAKGVSAATLANIAPVAPVVSMSREDKRFVEGYAVADGLDTGVNLAAIDWQDFENLIREIFEKEFNVNGGEVKITQASRDGGVDAVAFDPDPIRGGKIVIQAKRYTNVVGVSAVRDLYGTVLNEGATKGILVTTANYGSDAYKFAQGKPLTLMNGANLLALMQKHGYQARINLKEAKKLLQESK